MPTATRRNPWWPLLFLTHSLAGLYFAYETAGALAPDLQKDFGFDNHQIGLLYSAYSMPVIFSIFVGEYLNRKLGSAKCVLLFSSMISLGTFIVAFAPNFPVMFAGQILYGSGSSPLYLTSTIIMGKWFGTDAVAKRKVSISFGLVFAWCRFFSFAAFIFLPIISKNISLRFSMVFSALICASSFASGAIFCLIDYRNKYTLNYLAEEDAANKQVQLKSFSEEDEMEKTETKKQSKNYSLLASTDDSKEERTSAEETDTESASTETETDTEELNKDVEKGEDKNEALLGEGEKLPNSYLDGLKGVWRAIKGFSLSYWLVVGLCVLFVSDLYTCTAFLTQYLYDDWKYDAAHASAITSFVCLSNVITSPIAGWLAGYTQWRVKCIIVGSLNLVLIHSLFAMSSAEYQIVPAVVLASALGLTQSIMDTNLTPSIVFVVNRKDYSVAMSLASICYNIGLLLLPTICGILRDATNTWLSVNVTFITVSAVSVILACILKVVDWRNGNILDLPFIKPADRKSVV